MNETQLGCPAVRASKYEWAPNLAACGPGRKREGAKLSDSLED